MVKSTIGIEDGLLIHLTLYSFTPDLTTEKLESLGVDLSTSHRLKGPASWSQPYHSRDQGLLGAETAISTHPPIFGRQSAIDAIVTMSIVASTLETWCCEKCHGGDMFVCRTAIRGRPRLWRQCRSGQEGVVVFVCASCRNGRQSPQRSTSSMPVCSRVLRCKPA